MDLTELHQEINISQLFEMQHWNIACSYGMFGNLHTNWINPKKVVMNKLGWIANTQYDT